MGTHDLALLKGLLHLLQVGEMSDVRADTLSRGAQSADGVCDAEVDLSCVRLSGDGIGGRKSCLLAKDLAGVSYQDPKS